jgi:methyl-accepting chemotaxis protein
LFLLSGSALFGLVSWSINLATELELQRDVDEEMNEVKASAGTLDLPTLRRVVGDYVSKTEDTRYLLQDRAGQVLAGNLPAMAPVPGALLLHRTRKPMLMRGRGKLLPDGYLFVGVEDRETPRLHAAIVRAFVESLAVTFLLAVGGGALASINVLRRVDAIGRTSRDIMAGDLDRRLPLDGSNDEFDQLSAGLNAMLDRIQSLMAGLQQVSSDIAHDLRTIPRSCGRRSIDRSPMSIRYWRSSRRCCGLPRCKPARGWPALPGWICRRCCSIWLRRISRWPPSAHNPC